VGMGRNLPDPMLDLCGSEDLPHLLLVTMLVTQQRWHGAIRFLTLGEPSVHLSPRDVRLLSLHLERTPFTIIEAQKVLARIGWYVRS
jgi:hypothetical protein